MVQLEEMFWCMIYSGLAKMTLSVSQTELIKKLNQGFNNDVQSLMKFVTPNKPLRGILKTINGNHTTE